ncbi:uncharacterized protein [Littorina saxatilis]|uniref:uncharacterized protein n=1 Tax=Littorina saxatilis TaxID=31220 RepID=UPI0038B5E29F
MERRYLVVVLLGLCCVAPVVRGQDYVNVATGKTYRQISNHGAQGPSSNAANGDTDGVYESNHAYRNNCIHTDIADGSGHPIPDDENHWWEVDLGRVYPVQNITVWARSDFKTN